MGGLIARSGHVQAYPAIRVDLRKQTADRADIVPANTNTPPKRMRGLGDLIAAGTKAIGIQPCGGCRKRQAALNRMVPFGKKESHGSEPKEHQPPTEH